MIKLYDNITGQYLGTIADEDLQFLIDNLEEESFTDTDYYVDRNTLDLLKEKGMSEAFANLIETAMGGAEEVEIRYEKVS
jgi:hypothetical protein